LTEHQPDNHYSAIESIRKSHVQEDKLVLEREKKLSTLDIQQPDSGILCRAHGSDVSGIVPCLFLEGAMASSRVGAATVQQGAASFL